MAINFGVSSLIALGIGFMGDRLGLETSYNACRIIGLGLIPMAALLPWTISRKTGTTVDKAPGA